MCVVVADDVGYFDVIGCGVVDYGVVGVRYTTDVDVVDGCVFVVTFVMRYVYVCVVVDIGIVVVGVVD